MRFCKQPTKYSCGPTVILNALKWAGKNVSLRKDFHKIAKTCGLTSTGVSLSQFENALKTLTSDSLLLSHKVDNIDVEDIAEALGKGRAVILRHFHSHKEERTLGHYVLLYACENDQIFYGINYRFQTEVLFTKGEIKRLLRQVGTGSPQSYPQIWTLQKR